MRSDRTETVTTNLRLSIPLVLTALLTMLGGCQPPEQALGFDRSKIQFEGCYAELAREPVKVDCGWEYVIDFYAEEMHGGQDYAIWGFHNGRVVNLARDVDAHEGPYERIFMQFWDGNTAKGDVDFRPPSVGDLEADRWQLTDEPWAIDNSWHGPSDYATGWEFNHPAGAIDEGEAYTTPSGLSGLAGNDMIHIRNFSWGWGHETGLLWTLRVVSSLYLLPGDMTWSMPDYGEKHLTGGLHPVLGHWGARQP